MTYVFEITPVPKPRMTRRDKWKHRPIVDHYYGYKDELRLQANIQGLRHLTGKLDVEFIIPMPVSWSQKEKDKMDCAPHQPKNGNDIDNHLKSLFDIFETNDSFIYDIHATKHWGYKPKITITTYDSE